MAVVWGFKDWRGSTEAGLHSTLHFQSKLLTCALLSSQLCLKFFCEFFDGVVIIPMLVLVMKEIRNESQWRRYIDIYAHTHCVYICCPVLVSQGQWRRPLKLCRGVVQQHLYLIFETTGQYQWMHSSTKADQKCAWTHWFYIVWACWNLLCTYVALRWEDNSWNAILGAIVYLLL